MTDMVCPILSGGCTDLVLFLLQCPNVYFLSIFRKVNFGSRFLGVLFIMEGKSGPRGHKCIWSHCMGCWEAEGAGNGTGYKTSRPVSSDLPSELKF